MTEVSSLINVSEIMPEGQQFICLSFVKSKDKTLTGIRFGGAFETFEQAGKQAEAIRSLDENFHVFVGSGGMWLPFDPNPDSKEAGTTEEANEELDKIVKAHNQEREKVKLYETFRRNELLKRQHKQNIELNKQMIDNVKSSDRTDEDKKLSTDEIAKQILETENKIKDLTTKNNNITEELSMSEATLLEKMRKEEDEIKELVRRSQ